MKTTLKQYRFFLKLAEIHSLSQTARFFQVTPSAVTQQIHLLEEEIGEPLFFEKTTSDIRRGLYLTRFGERISDAVAKIVYADEDLDEMVRNHQRFSHTLRIATFKSVAVNWMPWIIKQYQKEHPSIQLEMIDGTYQDVESNLKEGNVHAAFVSMPYPLTDCEYFELYSDELLAALPLRHPLVSDVPAENQKAYRELPPVPAEQLVSEPMVSLVDNTDRDAREYLKIQHLAPNIRYRTSDDFAMLSMVEAELGVCIVHELVAGSDNHQIALRRLNPPVHRKIGLAIPKNQSEEERKLALDFYALVQNGLLASSPIDFLHRK